MRTDHVLKALALALLLPSILLACGDDTAVGGGGSTQGGGGSGGSGGSGGIPTTGGGGEGAGGAPPLNDTCETAAAITVASDESVFVEGSMAGAQDDYTTFCADNTAGESANDLLYEVTTTEDCTLQITLEAAFNGVISVRPVCATDDGNCFNASVSNDEIGRLHVPAGTFYVMVSDFANGGGDFTLSIECAVPICGDSVVGPTEDCDVGDTTAGDGCDENCIFEPSDPALDDCIQVTMNATHEIDLNTTLLLPSVGEQSTIGATDSGTGTCMYDPVDIGADPSPDHVYKMTPTSDGQLTLVVGNNETGVAACVNHDLNMPAINFPGPEPLAPWDIGCWDRAIHVRTDCDVVATEVGCTDTQAVSNAGWWDVETLTIDVIADTDYYVFVDGWADFGDGSDQGEYVLEVSLAP